MNSVMVQTEGLSKSYLKGKIVALEDVSLWVEKGESVSILGSSGSGKTTLLNMIGTLDKPTKGKVSIEGVDLSKVKNRD